MNTDLLDYFANLEPDARGITLGSIIADVEAFQLQNPSMVAKLTVSRVETFTVQETRQEQRVLESEEYRFDQHL